MSQRRATQRLITADTAIASAATVETDPMDLRPVKNLLGAFLKATSAGGTPHLKLEYALGRRNPTTSLLEFDGFDDHTDLIADHSSQDLEHLDLTSIVEGAEKIKFKFTGLGTNPADTFINLFEIVFEEDGEFP